MRTATLWLLALAACDGGTDTADVDTDTDTDAVDTDVVDTDDTDVVDTEVVDTDPIVAQPMTVTITPTTPLPGEVLTCAADTTTEVLYTWYVDDAPAGVAQAVVPVGTTEAYTSWRCEAVTVDGLFEGEASVDVAEECRSFAFDGDDDLVALEPRTEYNRLAADFTVDLWFWRASDDTVDDLVLHAGLLDSSLARTDYLLRLTDDGLLVFATGPDGDGDDCTYLEEDAPSAMAWHHVEASWEAATGRKRLFVDGLLLRTCVSTVRGAGAAGTLDVGASLTLAGNVNVLDGSIDEFRLSSSIRHTVNFVPATWHVSDADTIVLLHANTSTPGDPPTSPDAASPPRVASLANGAVVDDTRSTCDLTP